MVSHRLRACIIALTAVSSLSACVSLRVTSDVAPGVSAAQCHTFGWAGSFHYPNDNSHGVVNPLNEQRLRDAIAANLAAKGVQPARAGAPDCLVGYGLGSHLVVDGGYAYPPGPYWGWGWGWGWGWPGYGGWGWDAPYVYRQGIVAVNLYDGKSKQPLWHAAVNQSVSGLTGAAADNRIREAVAAIFTKYPG